MSLLLYLGVGIAAIVLSEAVFRARPGGSKTASDAFGLVVGLFYVSVGLFMLMGGGSGLVVGTLFLLVAWYMWRGNVSRLGLDDRVRVWLSGGS